MSYLKNLYNYLFHKSATLMNRHQLGSIDLSDIKEELTENEQKERNANIANSYKYIEPTIKKLLIAQQEFMAKQCENENQLLFGRGSINGIAVVLEELRSYKLAHEELTKPQEKFDKHEVF